MTADFSLKKCKWEDSRDPYLKCYKEIQVRIPYLEKIPQKFEVK